MEIKRLDIETTIKILGMSHCGSVDILTADENEHFKGEKNFQAKLCLIKHYSVAVDDTFEFIPFDIKNEAFCIAIAHSLQDDTYLVYSYCPYSGTAYVDEGKFEKLDCLSSKITNVLEETYKQFCDAVIPF